MNAHNNSNGHAAMIVIEELELHPTAAPLAATVASVAADTTVGGSPDDPEIRQAAHESDRLGGLVCVIACSTPAHATEVAVLLAHQARKTGAGVLVSDAAGGLSAMPELAGVHSRYSLSEAAALAAQEQLGEQDAVAVTRQGLHVLCAEQTARPLGAGSTDPDLIGALLWMARNNYELTVVDCGSGTSGQACAAYQSATHIVWVIDGTPGGLADGQRAFDRVRRHPTARELLVTLGTHPQQGRIRPKQAAALAAERHAPEAICLPYADGKPTVGENRLAGLMACWAPQIEQLARLTEGTVLR